MNCKICNKEYDNYRVLSIHIAKIHNISIKEYYDLYLKKENEGICIECGKETKFYGIRKAYSKYCSVQCLNKSEYRKNKVKETNLQRYGVEYPFQNKEIQKKVKQTWIEEYGVENPSQYEEIKEKIKKTNLEKYGVENPSQNKEIRKKIKQTNIERYGVENPLQSDIIKNKVKETNLQRYGIEKPLQNKEIQEKQKQTNLKKYGVEYPSQSNEIKYKVKQTYLNNYGVENYLQSEEFKEKKKQETIEKYKCEFPSLNIIDYNINDNIMICYCNECNKNYNIGLMMLGSRLRHLKYKNPCTNCYPINGHYSNQEKELVDYIKSIYDGKIIENDRRILKGQELDIYLPDLKIAFEYNGLYWHNLEYKDKDYHLNKSIECEKQCIQLVHIFENNWYINQTEIKKYIKDLINNTINITEYSLIFENKDNKIIVDRQFNTGKLLEKCGYNLLEITEPQKNNIFYNDKYFDIYDCGKLIFKK